MALSGEIMKYVGNELVSKEAEKGLSKVADKAASSALSNILSKEARNVGASMLDKAAGLGLSKNAGKWVLNTGILDTDAGVSQVKDFMKPILGEDTANYKRLLEQIGEGEYQMAHRPNLYLGDSGVKFPLSNMEADPDFLPKIYGDTQQGTVNNLLRLGNTGEEARRSANIIAQYHNQPDKMVKVYRQAPKDMNYGDWVGLTPEYANFHEGNSPENRLWEREVPASEVMFAGDDINEWGYYPKEVQLDDELGQALDLAIQNTGVDENAAMRAMGYITNDYGRLADKSGKPVKFYHSTPNEFSEFDNARLGDNTGYSNTALGHFVTEDKDFSSRFRDINNEGNVGTTMELQANVKNPVIHPYMAGQKYSDPAQLDRIVEDYYKAIGDEDSLNTLREYAADDGQSLYDEYMDMTLGEDPFESAADERNALMNNGYDAVEIVEGPRNSLVEGATEDTPVSSLAVLDGKNLRRTTNIPVSKADATGVDIDVRRGAKSLPTRDMNADGVINWQDVNAVHKQAGEQQKVLDKIGRAIAEKNNFPQYQDFKPKSIESMLNKVKRKGGNYSLASMKDHTRNKIIMNSWQDVPAVLKDMEKLGLSPDVEFVQNEWGYKGLHITGRFDNGLGWELQLSTPEDWPRKLKSDAIYDKWRNVDLDTASPKEVMGYVNAMRDSKAMWNESKIPDLSIYDNVTGR